MTSNLVDRFLRYVRIHTTSQEDIDEIPSTKRQFDLAHLLVTELQGLGLMDASVDEHCYVIATIPSNISQELTAKVPTLCLLAHMDTSPEEPGENVNPQIIQNYDGKEITLPSNPDLTISPEQTPSLKKFIGSDIITSDGTTLLGGDDKAGVAVIMTVIDTLVNNSSLKHGTIKIVFTPDEEVGHGVDALDVEALGADIGYTIDGDEMGVLESETFNAAGGTITIKGFNFHPGYAKDKLINALHTMGDILLQFPRDQAPETTEKMEGYYHVYEASGSVNEAKIRFILRDFDSTELHQKMQRMEEIVNQMKERYPKTKIKLDLKEQYKNMKYQLDKVPHVIEYAEEAIKRAGVDVIRKPVRGGTDGARLSYMGLPTPNIFAGSINFHSKKEFVPVIAMEKSVETILNLIQIYVEKSI
ncbi:MAG: peptidase T [Candidatus Heimdallarchaeota archaeon]|nr:MAG: peptidase T [Candidatus Heimdallarchaeota archaeon]